MALSQPVFQYQVWHKVQSHNRYWVLKPSIPQDSHCPSQKLQPTPLLAKTTFITSSASSCVYTPNTLPLALESTSMLHSVFSASSRHSSSFWQKLTTVSLWCRKVFCPAVLLFCPICLPFQQVCCKAAALWLSHYLRLFQMLCPQLLVAGKDFQFIIHDIKSPCTDTCAWKLADGNCLAISLTGLTPFH